MCYGKFFVFSGVRCFFAFSNAFFNYSFFDFTWIGARFVAMKLLKKTFFNEPFYLTTISGFFPIFYVTHVSI
jgi:hypothetical protein